MQRNEQIEFLEEYKKHISQGFGQYQPEVKEQCAKIDTWITALRAATIPQTGGYVTHDQAFKNAATVAEPSYTDSTSQLHVGGSSFESWYAGYAKKLTGNPKQTARDAYAAGMGDPLVMAREAAQQQAEPVGDEAFTHRMNIARTVYALRTHKDEPQPERRNWFDAGFKAGFADRAAQSGQRAGVAEGWCFYSADFSMNASNPANWGTVMLTRDDAGRKWWHALSDEEREKIDLFVSGRGTTFDAAMKSANEKAAAAPTPAAQGGV